MMSLNGRTVMNSGVIGERYMRLFGERTGIISDISHLPPDRGDPPVYVSVPRLTDVGGLIDAPVQSDFAASGKGYTLEESLITCIGETVERYALNVPPSPSKLVSGSYSEISEERQTPDFKYIQAYELEPDDTSSALNRETRMRWAAGERLTDGETIFLPQSLVWFLPGREEQPLTITSNGCAAGRTKKSAAASSLLEVIERDAMMRMWCRQEPPAMLNDVPEEVTSLLSEFTERGFDVNFYALESSASLPVVGCLLRSDTESLPKCGFASSADFSIAGAMRDALIEVGQGWTMSKSSLVDHDLDEIRRKERFESFREGYLYYSCTDAANELIELLNGGETQSTDGIANVEGVPEILSELAQAGCQPILFDLTSPDVRDAGLFATRVFVPELIPFTPPSDLPETHPGLSDVELPSKHHPFG